jgi:hypothetical protein
MFGALGYRPRILDMTPEESLKQDEMRLISDARRARRQQREDYRASVIREVEELKREGRRNRLRYPFPIPNASKISCITG